VTRLLLVRHAQSAWNEQGRWQGRADPPLSDLGRQQAASAAARVGAVDAIVSSPLERARYTAETIASATGIGPVSFDEDLIERDVGPWSGLTRAEIEAGWPGFLDAARRPPGFESDDDLVARVHLALARLVTTFPDADVLVITHGGVIGSLERHYGEPGGRLPNLSGRHVTHSRATLLLGDRVALLDEGELTIPAQL
jgi:broad specificity phosphatase PhoE